MWIWINTKYACGGIQIDKGRRIITAPPIWKKYKGIKFKKFMTQAYVQEIEKIN